MKIPLRRRKSDKISIKIYLTKHSITFQDGLEKLEKYLIGKTGIQTNEKICNNISNLIGQRFSSLLEHVITAPTAVNY